MVTGSLGEPPIIRKVSLTFRSEITFKKGDSLRFTTKAYDCAVKDGIAGLVVEVADHERVFLCQRLDSMRLIVKPHGNHHQNQRDGEQGLPRGISVPANDNDGVFRGGDNAEDGCADSGIAT